MGPLGPSIHSGPRSLGPFIRDRAHSFRPGPGTIRGFIWAHGSGPVIHLGPFIWVQYTIWGRPFALIVRCGTEHVPRRSIYYITLYIYIYNIAPIITLYSWNLRWYVTSIQCALIDQLGILWIAVTKRITVQSQQFWEESSPSGSPPPCPPTEPGNRFVSCVRARVSHPGLNYRCAGWIRK